MTIEFGKVEVLDNLDKSIFAGLLEVGSRESERGGIGSSEHKPLFQDFFYK